MCLKALRRSVNKLLLLLSKVYSFKMVKTKKKSSRARVDQPVNRIEFNRLQPAVEYVPEADASGASGPAHEKKKKSGSAGSYLSSPVKESSVKKSFKIKFPKSAPRRRAPARLCGVRRRRAQLRFRIPLCRCRTWQESHGAQPVCLKAIPDPRPRPR